MSGKRKVARISKSRPTMEGAGVHLRRVFGSTREAVDLDPFLLLDDFRSDDPAKYLAGFPWHPHRGIETITYMLEGTVEHGDSLGNRGMIGSGDVQWMTAGSGIVHQEMPKGDRSGRMGGFQLWANLPAREKMMDPRYRDVLATTIPQAALPSGGTAKVVCGTVAGVTGPVRDIVIEPQYFDVTLPAKAAFRHEVPKGHTVFAYVFEGSIASGDEGAISEHLVLFDREAGEVVVSGGDKGARFLLVSGRPLKEPIAWGGPIVMNTEEELQRAFEEYEQGTFLKHKRT